MNILNEKAKNIATQLYERGLQPWHVKTELQYRFDIPEYEREKLERMVTENLENMLAY